MMRIERSNQFKKSYKKSVKAHKDINKLAKIVDILVNNSEIPSKYHDHALVGKYVGERELHLEPDWLLIYHYEEDYLVLVLTDIGSHAYLF